MHVGKCRSQTLPPRVSCVGDLNTQSTAVQTRSGLLFPNGKAAMMTNQGGKSLPLPLTTSDCNMTVPNGTTITTTELQATGTTLHQGDTKHQEEHRRSTDIAKDPTNGTPGLQPERPHDAKAGHEVVITTTDEELARQNPSFDGSATMDTKKTNNKACWGRCKTFSAFAGPAWLVAMAYLDPGNLESDLLAGAMRDEEDLHRGYRLLWVIGWSTLFGFIFQRLAIKLGTATGRDLGSICHEEFPRWLCALIWIPIQLCLIGLDMQAVIGSAVAFQLLLGIPIPVGVAITLIDTFIILLVDFFGIRKLEACFAFMIAFMGVCFLVNMFTSKPSAAGIAAGLAIPYMPPGALQFSIGLIGSIIAPHNFFLQSSVVQARLIDRSKTSDIRQAIRSYSIEIFIVLAISLVINTAVVSSFANPSVTSPDGSELDLYNAHRALESALGSGSAVVWGLGLLAAGMCSTMANTYCGQFVMEGLLGWRIRRPWLRVLITRCISIVPVLLVVVVEQGTVEQISNWVNLLQAFVFPFVLVLLMKFTSSAKIMGEELVLSRIAQVGIYLIGLFLVVANIALVVESLGPTSVFVYILLAAYLIALGFLWWRPVTPIRSKSMCSTQDSKTFLPGSDPDGDTALSPGKEVRDIEVAASGSRGYRG